MSGLEVSTELKRQLQSIVDAARLIEASVGTLAVGADGREEVAHSPRATSAASEAAGILQLTDGQRRICERVINVLETGTIEGKYGAISIYRDGPNRIRQITYGRSQTTEYGNLRELVAMYVEAGGMLSASLRPYVDKIGRTALVDDETFKGLLRRAGNEDPTMRTTQDTFFDLRYFQPALRWASNHGFTRALSMLVIYDSFIHSGSIRSFLRERFPERPPASGGNEATWIKQYIQVRHQWLTNHDNPDVRPSNYRTRDLAREIAGGNWDLAIQPIMANGVAVRDTTTGAVAMMGMSATRMDGFSVSGNGFSESPFTDDEEWCECEPLVSSALRRSATAATPAELAQRILDHPNIKLATEHVSGVADNATARQNIVDTAAGRAARRSSYGNAPGGTVSLNQKMLSSLITLAETYKFDISEFCGGSHSPNSRHYRGVVADVNFINDRHVEASHPDQASFRARCTALGATQVLGPGNSGHSRHIHAGWPVTN